MHVHPSRPMEGGGKVENINDPQKEGTESNLKTYSLLLHSEGTAVDTRGRQRK